MGYLLPALTEAKFSNQRAVVLNERRQNYENRPYGLSAMAMLAALFPPDHPYHWTTIGEVADLNAVRLDEVHAFFARYYHPANASLALAGDIDSDQALALVRAYFEDIPAGEKVEPVRADGVARRRHRGCCSRIASSCRGSTWRGCRRRCSPRATPISIWPPTCSPTARRRACIGGWSSRNASRPTCRRRRTRGRSADTCSWRPRQRPATRSASSSGSILEEIGRLGTDGPTDDEIERGRVQAEAQFVFRLQTVGGFGGKSDQLNAYNVFLGDPVVLRPRPAAVLRGHQPIAAADGRPLSRSGAAGDAQHRAARPHRARGARLGAGGRLVKVERLVTIDRSRLPEPGADRPGQFSRHREVGAAERPAGLDRPPRADAGRGVLAARSAAARRAIPPGKHGLAAMTADMLDEGSGDRSAIEMHEAIARLGTQLETDIGVRRAPSPASPS